MSEQQGDVQLLQTVNGGEITVNDGITKMSGGLETSIYLSLFGGNDQDDGLENNKFNWWGNRGQTLERQYRSKTQFLLQALVFTSSNLLRVEESVLSDIKYLIDLNIANIVKVFVSIPSLNKINIKINIQADGFETEFDFTENWKSLKEDIK